ncbi:hypothetical protein K5D69_12265 [Pseudomonas cichorii]|uniref:hypothetical protein n=1 Tax=Pseudomonas cichorii TaxID=36746 RepID=UPI001C8AE27E|nr:hypothetical protein [Pseudomonas cichorii]MBX8515467.1 hypothetical protein [Pseudomonas cichorii]
MHSDNPHIKQMFTLVTASLAKGLSALSNGESTYSASILEKYAQEIFGRVAEIDNAFKNINITLEYLSRNTYADSKYSFSEHHAFHVENLLLRLTTIVDRSYLLAGSTMLMENRKIERLGGNRTIYKELEVFSPVSSGILKNMEGTLDPLRGSRNKIAHQAGFSSEILCILQAVENSKLESISIRQITDVISYDELKNLVITESLDGFKSISSTLDAMVSELIDSLSFVYSGLLKDV